MAEPHVPADDYRRVRTRMMWNLGGLTPWECGQRAVAGYREHKLEHRAVYFAFYALYSLAPITMVVVSTIVLLLAQSHAEDVLEGLKTTISDSLPGDASRLINTEMDREAKALWENTNWWVVVVGWSLMVYSGRTMLLTVSSGLDAAYGVDKRRRFWHRNAVALGVILLTVFSLLALSVVLQLTADEILLRLSADGRYGWARTVAVYGLKWVLAVGFLLAAVSMVYTFVPSCRLRWTPLSPGGAFFAATFLVSTQAFRYYIKTFGRYGDTYGALAGVVVLMTWLWLTGTLLLFGGQINSVIHRHSLRELFMKDRRKTREVPDVPKIGGLSDPRPEEVDAEIARDDEEERAGRDRDRRAGRDAAHDELDTFAGRADDDDDNPPVQPPPGSPVTPASAPVPAG